MRKIEIFALFHIMLLFMACDSNLNSDSGNSWTPHINNRQVFSFGERFTGNATLRGYINGGFIHHIDIGRIENGRVFVELPKDLDVYFLGTDFNDWVNSLIEGNTAIIFSKTSWFDIWMGNIARCSAEGDFLTPLQFNKNVWVNRNDPYAMIEVQEHRFSFVYFSEDTKITSRGTSIESWPADTINVEIEISINVKKGWSVIYYTYQYNRNLDPNNAIRLLTSEYRIAPSDMRWEIMSTN